MEGFNENERRGLIGKIIHYFDNGSPTFQPANGCGLYPYGKTKNTE